MSGKTKPRLGGRETSTLYLRNIGEKKIQDTEFTNGEIKDTVCKFKKKFKEKIYLLYQETARIFLIDLLHIDEFKDEINKLIYSLVGGEVTKRTKHALSKIAKHMIVRDKELTKISFDYDDIIFDHHFNLINTLERFFDIKNLQIPFKKLPYYVSGKHDMYEWYPDLTKEINEFLQMTITNLTEIRENYRETPDRLISLEKEIDQLHVRKALSKESQGAVDEDIHILKTRILYDKLEHHLVKINFPTTLTNLDSKTMENILFETAEYRRYDCTLTIWCQIERILRNKWYSWHNLGIELNDEDDNYGTQKYHRHMMKSNLVKEKDWKFFYSDEISMDDSYKTICAEVEMLEFTTINYLDDDLKIDEKIFKQKKKK